MKSTQPNSVQQDEPGKVSSPKIRSSGIPVGIVFMLLLAMVSIAIWFFYPAPDSDSAINGNAGTDTSTVSSPISSEQAEEFIRKANRAHGLLEDEQADAGRDSQGQSFNGYAESIRLYQQLRTELPDESMPIRNLSIAKTLRLLFSMTNEERTEEAYQQTISAIEKFQEAEPGSAIPYLMLAAIREKQLDFEKAVHASLEDLRRAKTIDADSIAAHYAFIQAAELFGGGSKAEQELIQREQSESYQQLFRLAPDNIELLKTWPPFLARQSDSKLKEVLEQSRELFLIAGRMQAIRTAQPKGTNRIAEQLEKALTAIDKEEWRQVLQATMLIGNLMNGLAIQQADLNILQPYFLEYVDFDFSEQFFARIEVAEIADADESSRLSQKTPGELFNSSKQKSLPISFVSFQAVDFDHDVDVDLVGISGQKLVVFTQQDDRSWQPFIDHDLQGDFSGVLVADLDRDSLSDESWQQAMKEIAGNAARSQFLDEAHADPDVVVFGPSGLKVLINDGDQLTEVPQNDDVATLKNINSAVLVDLEADSDLDLVVATDQGIMLLLNIGKNMFADFSDASILPDNDTRISSLRIVDWDRDADIDVVVGLENQTGVGLLENLLHGRFRWRKLDGKFSDFDSSQAMDVAEIDGNVSWDIVAAGQDSVSVCLTHTSHSNVSPTSKTQFGKGFSGIRTADLDNDTWVDIVGWRGNTLQLHSQRTKVAGSTEFSMEYECKFESRIVDCLTADMDMDGDLDLVVSTADQTIVHENQSRDNGWINLMLVGIDENKGRVNHNGIGSLVELKIGSRYQAQVATSPRIHFGLGDAEKADVLRIVWTNGMPQNIIDPAARLVIRETMFAKGSCPFIYVWNGQRFEFFSDCLWGAPIGLQLAEGVVAPTRPWEFLKISGDLLVADGDHYRLQLTEELWEAAYFDQVELIAVDHPADIDVYTNEKVGPPSIAQHKILTVSQPRIPIAATDIKGRDVLELIAKEDGIHMQGFEKTLRKGLAPEHFLELNLGDLKDAKQVTLFLTGWIRPADSSLNIHFSQHQTLDGPRPPEVYVPDANGAWQRVISPMGFPGGKTKTMAVDLSDAFLADDFRLRVQTSNEIYWDHVFFTVDEPSQPVATHGLTVESADVHYRGFSRNFFKNSQSPEWFDYQQVSTAPRWPAMTGRFTRYGDVTELLRDADDQMVVIGAGDEITVSFPVPEKKLTAGWKRDFILHSVGYDKDADLNTLTGQSSEPLPFLEMKNYPISGAQESIPDSTDYREFLRQYQTRTQSWRRFWRYVSTHDESPGDVVEESGVVSETRSRSASEAANR